VNVTLNAGSNLVNLAYESSSGSSNYLNLDQMVFEPVYEAELGTLHSLSTESTNTGYTGTGYVAGWNANNQSVDITVSAPITGYYTLTLRYSAAAGAASRYLRVNGTGAVNNLSFPGGSSWSDYKTITTTVNLNLGNNTISLIYDSTKGSANYLNLDNLISKKSYEAELGTLNSLTTEATNAGYTGTGYIAGWNSNNQWVDFSVNVPTAGTYTLTFSYAAGAGAASRYLYINGVAIINNLTFPGGSSWNDYKTVTTNVSLNAGANTISLRFDSSKGSTNYLNLDNLAIGKAYEAELGTLHSISTESSNSGYLGSGYIAGWNSNGQWVDFTVNVPTAGKYALTFRYAAGAGYASRYLFINGASAVDNLSFPLGSSWSDYKTITTMANLNAGNNTLSLLYDSSKGSINYLNLDQVTVRQ